MTEDQIAALARELADVQDQIAGLALRENDVKARIVALVPGPDKYAAGDATLIVQSNTRFDQKKAEEAIPADLLPLVTVEKTTTSIDRKKVEVLAPDYLDACIVHYADKVSLR